MKYKSEQQIKKKLGIETWRNLSKDKVVKFAAMMPDMDKEVMLKVIEQFPEFTKYASGLLETLNETLQMSMEKNSKDYQASLEIIKENQLIYKDLLAKEYITTEERILIINNLNEITITIRTMDKENKKFYKFVNSDAVKAYAMGIGAAIVMLGGKVIIDSLLSGEDEELLGADADAIDVDYEEV